MTGEKQERYGVYHANDLHAMVAPQADHWFKDPARHYTHVAEVEAPHARVFALTNHIDRPWPEHPEVVWHTNASPLRSTSVGDVIVSRQSGRAWLVMPLGWHELLREDEPGVDPADDGRQAGTAQPSDEGKESRS